MPPAAVQSSALRSSPTKTRCTSITRGAHCRGSPRSMPGTITRCMPFPKSSPAERGVTEEVCKAVMNKFGGGDVVGVTGVEGNSTDLIRSRGRDDAMKAYPKIKLAGELPGNGTGEKFQKAMEALYRATSQDCGGHCAERRRCRWLHGGLARSRDAPGSDVFRVARARRNHAWC